jgi:hypothetical protein
MTGATFWLLIKALITVTPWLLQAIQEGKIRASSQEELENAIMAKINKRVDAARAAKLDDSLPDPYGKE